MKYTLNEVMNYIYNKQIETGYNLKPWGFKELITIIYEIELDGNDKYNNYIDLYFKECIEDGNCNAIYI